jgi:UDP-glucose 4-epimerase
VSIEGCLLITGGTGSFGNAVLSQVLKTQIEEVRVFSRDEKKQDEQRTKYADPRISYIIGDTRDHESVLRAMQGVDYVFHAAALKQVPSCEFFPVEAVKTNILGTENVLSAAMFAGVKRVICLSTDKAVYPINAMGMSKALMEKVMVAHARATKHSGTVFCATRYGNVMASRGSVIPRFLDQIKNETPLTITDPNMTRFMMTLEDAIELVMHAFHQGESGDIFVQKAPAATIQTLVNALFEVLGISNHPVDVIGTRHGEKLFEVLLSREEVALASSADRYFRIAPDVRDLNYEKYYVKGDTSMSSVSEYTSHNTKRLSVAEMVGLLEQLELVRAFRDGRTISDDRS